MFFAWYDAPFTRLQLAGSDAGLHLLLFEGGKHCRDPIPEGWTEAPQELAEVIRQLDAYFAGELTEFDVKLAPKGTEFQHRVWAALAEIPYGETRTYGQIAETIGQPKASRAVGAANGQNPISIIVPCHRVIGSTGKLTGFGGGLNSKSALLNLERRFVTPEQPALF